MLDNLKLVEKFTKMNQESQNQRLRIFGKVDITIKLEIIQQQTVIFHKLKSMNNNVDKVVLTLSSLILAIDSIIKELDVVNLNIAKLRGKNVKAKIKRQKVLGNWAIIRTLRLEQNMSFRSISAYFAKHKFEVSYSSIYKMWNEIENNNIIKDKENEIR
jgi:hypothetical protein